jgi:hypothetical protein
MGSKQGDASVAREVIAEVGDDKSDHNSACICCRRYCGPYRPCYVQVSATFAVPRVLEPLPKESWSLRRRPPDLCSYNR